MCAHLHLPSHGTVPDAPTKMVVTWVTQNKTSASIVRYGISGLDQAASGNMTTFVDGGSQHHTLYIHRVTLSGLIPGQKYGNFFSFLNYQTMYFMKMMTLIIQCMFLCVCGGGGITCIYTHMHFVSLFFCLLLTIIYTSLHQHPHTNSPPAFRHSYTYTPTHILHTHRHVSLTHSLTLPHPFTQTAPTSKHTPHPLYMHTVVHMQTITIALLLNMFLQLHV